MAKTAIEIKLNKLGKEVRTLYPAINRGGCCVYAAMVASALKKHNITAQGIVASWSAGDGPSIDEARNNIQKNTIKQWEDNGIFLSHVGIEFTIDGKKKHYDTDGVHAARARLNYNLIYKGRMDYKEMADLAAKRTGWNSSFNRRDIPAIRKLVNTRLAVDSLPI